MKSVAGYGKRWLFQLLLKFTELMQYIQSLQCRIILQQECGTILLQMKVSLVSLGFPNSKSEFQKLTKREFEILTDLCHGLTREETAVNRDLSVNTRKTYAANHIYEARGF